MTAIQLPTLLVIYLFIFSSTRPEWIDLTLKEEQNQRSNEPGLCINLDQLKLTAKDDLIKTLKTKVINFEKSIKELLFEVYTLKQEKAKAIQCLVEVRANSRDPVKREEDSDEVMRLCQNQRRELKLQRDQLRQQNATIQELQNIILELKSQMAAPPIQPSSNVPIGNVPEHDISEDPTIVISHNDPSEPALVDDQALAAPVENERVIDVQAIAEPVFAELVTNVQALEEPAVAELVTNVKALAEPVVNKLVTEVNALAEPDIAELVTDAKALAGPVFDELVTDAKALAEPVVAEVVPNVQAFAETVVAEVVTDVNEVAEPLAAEVVTDVMALAESAVTDVQAFAQAQKSSRRATTHLEAVSVTVATAVTALAQLSNQLNLDQVVHLMKDESQAYNSLPCTIQLKGNQVHIFRNCNFEHQGFRKIFQALDEADCKEWKIEGRSTTDNPDIEKTTFNARYNNNKLNLKFSKVIFSSINRDACVVQYLGDPKTAKDKNFKAATSSNSKKSKSNKRKTWPF